MNQRYNRHIILSEIGVEGQEKLLQAKVLVIGAGGLGCPILQYLVAAGIGTIGIVDFDRIDETNLQRQVLFRESDVGKNKALIAKERLQDLNSDIHIEAYTEKLTHQNALELFEMYDIIVDGTDNFYARYLINDASIIMNKPVVYGAIYKFEGQVSVMNYKGGPTYRCLFPTPPKADDIPDCNTAGVLGVLPGIIGTMQANEVLKMILGIGTVLSGKVLFYNALTVQTQTMQLKRSEEAIHKIKREAATFSERKETAQSGISIPKISITEITEWEGQQLQWVDVRNEEEMPKIEEVEVLSIPLSEIRSRIHELNTEKKKIIFCQSGIRSQKAVEILSNEGITDCWSVIEGAYQIQEELQATKLIKKI